MAKVCEFCTNKAKFECQTHRLSACRKHAVKCPYCGKISCINCFKDVNYITNCPNCKKNLLICPNCLKNGQISRLQIEQNICKICGFKK